MPLPRPARILRQQTAQLGRGQCQRSLRSTARTSAKAQLVERDDLDENVLNLDQSFDGIISDMNLGTKRVKPTPSLEAPSPTSRQSKRSAQDQRHAPRPEASPSSTKQTFGLKPAPRSEWEFDDDEPREERRSPAAVFGSKRIGSASIPPELNEAVEELINDVDPTRVRFNFTRLRDNVINKKRKVHEPELVIAKAAAYLPGEFAAVRNVLDEMERRFGREWLEDAARVAATLRAKPEEVPADELQELEALEGLEDEGDVVDETETSAASEAEQGPTSTMTAAQEEVEPPASGPREWDGKIRVVDVSSSLGAGIWATVDSRGTLPSARDKHELDAQPAPLHYLNIHHSNQSRDLIKDIADVIPKDVAEVEHMRRLDRRQVPHVPALAMSTFFLSNIPSQAREGHLKAMLALSSPYLVLVDHGTPAGWTAMKHARRYLLSRNTAEEPIHIVAPCPHEDSCPLAHTDDQCSFSQRIQSPRFLRKTKHSKRGEEDKAYTYLVIARGPRPTLREGDNKMGRLGAVGREFLLKQQEKREGKSVLRIVEGVKEGREEEFEMVSLDQLKREEDLALDPADREPVPDAQWQLSAEEQADLTASLRRQAYSWPRLVNPPLKRSGHVVLDKCCPDGNIHREIHARSHSKQAYYDARKSYWGDLFPHEPKGHTEIRQRGIRRLVTPEMVTDSIETEKVMAELFGREPDVAELGGRAPRLPKGLTLTLGPEKSKRAQEIELRDALRKEKQNRGKTRREIKEEENMRPGKKYRLRNLERFDPESDSTALTKDLDAQYDEAHGLAEAGQGHKDKKKKARNAKGRAVREGESEDLVSGSQADQDLPLWMTSDEGVAETTISSEGLDGKPEIRIEKSNWAAYDGRRKYGTWTRPALGLGLAGSSYTPRRHMSARPAARPKVTLAELGRMREASRPITVLTAYDYPTALLGERSGVDITLVGDSLSQVALGHETTTEITLDEMIHHCKAVARGAKTPFVLADVPFGSFEASVEKGVESVIRLVKEGKADGVKIEGGLECVDLVKRLSEVGIPVMAHIGLQPQRATSTSGYLVQGRSVAGAKHLVDTALALQDAGAAMFLIEAIPHALATYITKRVRVPTIGIGAGPGTDGQVLVVTDVLGVYAPDPELDLPDSTPAFAQPKFVRQFGNVGSESRRAIGEYLKSVRDGSFPAVGKETYGMKKDEWEGFLSAVGENKGETGEKE